MFCLRIYSTTTTTHIQLQEQCTYNNDNNALTTTTTPTFLPVVNIVEVESVNSLLGTDQNDLIFGLRMDLGMMTGDDRSNNNR